MENTLKKSDFVLVPYMKANNLKATYQVLNTLIPYVLLWFAAAKLAPISFWFLPPIVVLIVLFSLRCFSLMHDCGHHSLFTSKKVNRAVGFVFGVVNAIPQYWWARDHAFHHKTNGDWERYRGIGDFMSTDEFARLSDRNQRLYELATNPLMIFPGGFFYLAIKPRMILLAGIYDFIQDVLAALKSSSPFNLSKVIHSHQAKHWSTAAEFWDVLFNNVAVVGSWIVLCKLLGPWFFLGMYAAVLTLAAATFICVFFVQHNFEGAYAHKTEGWDYLLGAVEGSSYLAMPEILKWFTADISYHSVHHLSERIPNYNLRACHRANRHLLTNVKTLHLSDLRDCAKFVLWDAMADQLTSIEAFRQSATIKTQQVRA